MLYGAPHKQDGLAWSGNYAIFSGYYARPQLNSREQHLTRLKKNTKQR
jgi:hypothetical protein